MHSIRTTILALVFLGSTASAQSINIDFEHQTQTPAQPAATYGA